MLTVNIKLNSVKVNEQEYFNWLLVDNNKQSAHINLAEIHYEYFFYKSLLIILNKTNLNIYSRNRFIMSKKYDLKFKNSKKLAKIKSLEVEEKELTRSPISGTYILKDWNNDLKCVKEKMKQFSNEAIFSKSEVALNSIAASFVEITPQAKARLEKIPNKIGPYECKLCKVVYVDAFELAMHNCPRVVHMEYK